MFTIQNKIFGTSNKLKQFSYQGPEILVFRRRSGFFIANFEHISHLVLVFLLLTLSRQLPTGLWALKK